ncbi:hypothetical protein [Actinoalloteichus hymeniacidonis]|uniref:Small secreted domain-containing protein (DUF320) n=1 Tax=Actinoalloteichus hymeniacidonis TaxID=340345 RepID=A0AAC9N0A5_9PSEU|nr:hypothetical protein [Actinoalloteichus hymeniacidonis]AOS65369.1 hypothetical protein TL08_22945 [Actinoalloteichus hymeniacidonis]MBB5906545.1 hypothetical protein [Actinoalloteichus hymeniacidonis]
MRTSARIAGAAAGAALGVLTLGGPAFADSIDNDGVNAVNDNNISAVPVQLCGNNVAAVIGVIIPVLSPQINDCTNAPITDDVANTTIITDGGKGGHHEHHGHQGKGAPHAGR